MAAIQGMWTARKKVVEHTVPCHTLLFFRSHLGTVSGLGPPTEEERQ